MNWLHLLASHPLTAEKVKLVLGMESFLKEQTAYLILKISPRETCFVISFFLILVFRRGVAIFKPKNVFSYFFKYY